jgi:hypothetical protein
LRLATRRNNQMNQIGSLPSLDRLVEMNPLERKALEAKIKARLLTLQRQNLKTAMTTPDIVNWAENHFWLTDKVNIQQMDYSKAKKIVLSTDQKRILRKVFTINPKTGRFPYRTVVYSAPKKSGKSTIGSLIEAYFAACIEAPNNIYCLANDREQSAGRVFGFALPTLYALGGKPEGKYRVIMPNGSIVQALTSNASKEAGGTYGLTIWDELWAYKSELARLLWDEMMPIDTRENSLRLVVTYAGFEDSSDLLFDIYSKVFVDTSEEEIKEGANVVEELKDIVTTNPKGNIIPCCYEVPKSGLFYYNDHSRRMSWQTSERGLALKDEVEEDLTPVNRFRLFYNMWQKTENRFLEPEWIDESFEPLKDETRDLDGTITPLKVSIYFPPLRPMTFSIDASQRNDCTGLLGTFDYLDYYCTGYAKAWYPLGIDIDLEETVMAEIVRLFRQGLIARRDEKDMTAAELKLMREEGLIALDVWYDPTHFHQVAMNLRKKHRLMIFEFIQGGRDKADTFLQQRYMEGKVWNQNFEYELIQGKVATFRDHLEAARGEQMVNKNNLVKIVKASGKHAKPVDLAVCQSMAVFRRSKRVKMPTMIGMPQGKSAGWTPRGEKRKRERGTRPPRVRYRG